MLKETCQRVRRAGYSLFALAVCSLTGCSVEESIVDGFFGGISDSVAAVIASILLASTTVQP